MCLLVSEAPLVTLPPFLFDDFDHLALGMLHHGCADGVEGFVDIGCTFESVVV